MAGLQGSTRLLVTHQRQHLPGCDRVIVLRDGRVAADGTFAQLVASGSFSSELGGGACDAAVELDDTAYDEGLSAGTTPAEDCGPTIAEDRPPVTEASSPGRQAGQLGCVLGGSSAAAASARGTTEAGGGRQRGGNASNRALVPASVFGGGGSNDGSNEKSAARGVGVSVDGAGMGTGGLKSRGSSAVSGLQSAASRMRRNLSRCAS